MGSGAPKVLGSCWRGGWLEADIGGNVASPRAKREPSLVPGLCGMAHAGMRAQGHPLPRLWQQMLAKGLVSLPFGCNIVRAVSCSHICCLS